MAGILLLVSCGQSTQEKAAIENEVMQRIKAHDDSVELVKSTQEAIKTSQKMHDDSIANAVSKKYQNKENLVSINNQYNSLVKLLIEDDAKMTTLVDRKNQDAKFHLGRSQTQREQWLSNDQKNIDNLQIQMANIKDRIQTLKAKMNN